MINEEFPLVSVVVPVYNTSAFLPKCVQSLMAQTYERIEYIFVNDASTDTSLQMLNQFKQDFPHRILRIISLEENGGLANARNIGRQASTGEYLAFCDSDDWVEPDMISRCVEAAIKENADIVTFPFFINESTVLGFPYPEIVGNVNEMPNNALHYSMCNKMMRTSLINGNGFWATKGVDCWEDLIVTAKAYMTAKKVVALTSPLYHYRKDNQQSLTSQNHKKILADHLIYVDTLEKWLAVQGREVIDAHAKFLLQLKFTAKIKMLRGKPKEFRRWKHTYPCSTAQILSLKNIPLRYRIPFAILNLIVL